RFGLEVFRRGERDARKHGRVKRSGEMGREARCIVRHDGREAEARAELETDELTVRTPFRLKVPRSKIASTEIRGDELEVAYDGGSVTLVLGEREAARWGHVSGAPTA